MFETQMTSSLTVFARLIVALVLTSLPLTMKADTVTNKILFDFKAATNSPAWEVVNDDVMGGVSKSQFQVLTNGCALFSGVVSLENNGGFASVRSSPIRADLAGYDAFLLRVRGDGRRYKFTARSDRSFDSAIYQIVFTTKKGEWEEHRLPMKEMVPTFRGRVLSDVPPPDPAKVASVGFLISDKQDGRFQLELAWIKASARQ
jgi:monofunctional biosynthetic peptidoglycan transglycosylase